MKIMYKSTNLGIQLLRFLLCLWIVIAHCSIIKIKHTKYVFRGFHVPLFVLLAFYFYYPSLSLRKIEKIKARFMRLMIPYLLWPLIIIILNNSFLKFFSFSEFGIYLSFKTLYFQYIIGTPVHTIFWFQFNLIFLSLFFTIILFISKTKSLIIFQIIGTIALYLQTTQLNYNFFIIYRGNYGKNIASLIELAPLSAIGFKLSSINFLSRIRNFPLYLHLILFLFIYLIFKYDIFVELKGYRYPNIFLYILSSMILLLFFGSLNSFNGKNINNTINNITKFTGGIYYIHPILYHYSRYIQYFRKRTYFSSIIIYIFCYFICFIGNKIFINYKLKY